MLMYGKGLLLSKQVKQYSWMDIRMNCLLNAQYRKIYKVHEQCTDEKQV